MTARRPLGELISFVYCRPCSPDDNRS